LTKRFLSVLLKLPSHQTRSPRPSPLCENRKTGCGRARTCNFGNIMSLARC